MEGAGAMQCEHAKRAVERLKCGEMVEMLEMLEARDALRRGAFATPSSISAAMRNSSAARSNTPARL